MAAIVNARDVLLQAAGTRLVTITLPSNTPPDWNDIIGGGKPSDNADVTVTAVNGGIVVTGGGITLSGGGSIKGGKTAYATGTGFFLGYSSGLYRFDIGSSTSYMRWTGSALELIGNIAGASSINIDGSARFKGSYASGGVTAAVYANESDTAPTGLYGRANSTDFAVRGFNASSGTSGGGVTGVATAIGVSGLSTGSGGVGVRAHNTGGGLALDVLAKAEFASSGTSENCITVVYSGSSGTAAKLFNSTATKEVWLAPTSYAAYSPSGGGKQYFVDGAGPFTGFHPGLGARDLPFTIGDILVDDEILFKPDVSNALGTMRHSSMPLQRGVIGVLSGIGDIPPEVGLEFDYVLWWELVLAYQWLDANGIGEGLVNVCGEGGDIEKGDLIVTSSTPGKGMRQADDVVRGYTVAKARECVHFDGPADVRQVACIYLAG